MTSIVKLTAENGETFHFPTAFLRENLKESIDKNSLQRVSFNLPISLNIINIKQTKNNAFDLTFSDGVTGTFVLPPKKIDSKIEDFKRTLWGGEFSTTTAMLSHLLETSYKNGGLKFMWGDLQIDGGDSSDSNRSSEQLGAGRAILPRKVANARSKLIEAVRVYGLANVVNVPIKPDQGIHLANSIVGAVETTNFGYKFVIKSVPDPHNLAFDSIFLQHHHDFTYCKKIPDIGMFYCLENADSGGDSLWMDGFAAAEKLKQDDPEAFQLLVHTDVLHMDITDKWDLQACHPTIILDKNTGELERIVFNERTRDSWRQWNDKESLTKSPEFYAALRKYERLAEGKGFEINTPLKPGQMILFDNNRIMHSRTSFEVVKKERHMEGAYIDWGAAGATWKALQPQINGENYVYCGNTVGLELKARM